MTDVLTPVRKTRELPCPPQAAFALFTDRIGDWWPTEAFSVTGDRVRSVIFEPVVGGHVYETDDAGDRHDWATVVAHDAPHRLELDWYPGRSPAEATRVEVSFTATAAGCTLELVHGGWPADRSEQRANYETGWDHVLAPLVTLAGA